MNKFQVFSLAGLLFTANPIFGQTDKQSGADKKTDQSVPLNIEQPAQKVVVVTGARFSYELIEKWIDEYLKVNTQAQIVIESRGSADPLKYEILAEVFEHDDQIQQSREYVNVGRYAILPVANSQSSFAKTYSDIGLNADLINQIFFNDIIFEKEKQKPIQSPFTVYTRLQKAGVPLVFSSYFGHEQKDLKGIAIAGADVHLLKAVLRDSTSVTYLPLPLIYDKQTRKPVEGLTVLPVDLNGNKKISDEEKFYNNIDHVIEILEGADPGKIKNVPIEYLHLSVDRQHASVEAIEFLKWVNENGHNQLHQFGYLTPEAKHRENAKFSDFASKHSAHDQTPENK